MRFKILAALGLSLAMLGPATAQPLIFAAASLTDAMTAVAAEYAKTGQPAPNFSFAASSALARQIENGAPAAIFISADEQWMDYITERNLIAPESRHALLGNRLVLVSRAAHPLSILIEPNFALAKALGDSKLALADPDSVPAGRYAKAALESLGVWTELEGNVVRAENVRAALAFVERGEAVAGVVYATDAVFAKNITVVGALPAASHPVISYPMALIGPTPSEDARQFYAFLRSASAKDIYQKFGFTVQP